MRPKWVTNPMTARLHGTAQPEAEAVQGGRSETNNDNSAEAARVEERHICPGQSGTSSCPICQPADAPSSSDERRWTLVHRKFDETELVGPALKYDERVEVVPSEWKELAEELLHTLDLTNDWNWQQHRAERLRDRTRAEAAEERAEQASRRVADATERLLAAENREQLRQAELQAAEERAEEMTRDRDEAWREVERLREALTFAADDLDKDEAA